VEFAYGVPSEKQDNNP